MVDHKEKCVNPWFGFLVIALVCILIASAIFFEFKGSSRRGRARLKAMPKRGVTQAAFSIPGTEAQKTQDKFLF